MGKGSERNDPCWCGSGRKYKRCHLDRERQERPPVSDGIKAFQHVQRREVCFHPDASPDECRGRIVRAHTVQEKLLRRIARKGQVYGFSLDFGALVSSEGVRRPRLMGVGQASTFPGFCSRHDDSFFAEIEKEAIQAVPRHACLLAYRALCRELHAKEGGVLLDPDRRTIDRGLAVPDQIAFQVQNASHMTGLAAGLNDIREQKRQYDRILREDEYSDIRYCVIWLDAPPDIMCSACTMPDWDFKGNRIQDYGDLSTPAQGIALSLVASEDRGCAYFSWLAHEERACHKLVRSLLELGREQVAHALVRFVWSSFENQFWRPEWWDALNQDRQNALIERLNDANNPFLPISPDYLVDDGLRVVNWRIAGVETNDEDLSSAGRMLALP